MAKSKKSGDAVTQYKRTSDKNESGLYKEFQKAKNSK